MPYPEFKKTGITEEQFGGAGAWIQGSALGASAAFGKYVYLVAPTPRSAHAGLKPGAATMAAVGNDAGEENDLRISSDYIDDNKGVGDISDHPRKSSSY